MEQLLIFLGSYLVSFLCYYVSVVAQKRKYEKFKQGTQINFFKRKYGLKFKNITIGKFLLLLSFVYGFIIATTLTIVSLINGLLWQLLIGLVIMIPLILLAFKILGFYIRKKEL